MLIGVLHLAGEQLEEAAGAALSALAGCPGFVRGSLGSSPDDPAAWLLVTEWVNVGSYRRALGSYQVKLALTPLSAHALDVPSAFERRVEMGPGA